MKFPDFLSKLKAQLIKAHLIRLKYRDMFVIMSNRIKHFLMYHTLISNERGKEGGLMWR